MFASYKLTDTKKRYKKNIARKQWRFNLIHKAQHARAIKGSITVPGDKSISHRALLLGAIAEGITIIRNLSPAADVRSTLNCLKQLQVETEEKNSYMEIEGKGLYGIKASSTPLNCSNSGTTMRLLSGILAAQPFSSTLIGDESLNKRPMNRIIEPLTRMGAKIESLSGGLAPLAIHGNRLRSIYYQNAVASAQVKSCIMLAALYAPGLTTLVEPHLSRDHTERMFSDFGFPIKRHGLKISLIGPAKLIGCQVDIPGDFSSAAFFIGAALITPNSQLEIKNVGINPTRTGLLDVLNQMGAKIEINKHSGTSSEPIGDLKICTSQLNSVEITSELIPRLIDEIPILAIITTQAKGRTILSGARELRVKESDRLHAITKNLSLMGAQIEQREDGFIIQGPQKLNGAILNSFNDHRIAMSFSIAGLIAHGETQIVDAECVAVSMPNFFDVLKGVVVA